MRRIGYIEWAADSGRIEGWLPRAPNQERQRRRHSTVQRRCLVGTWRVLHQ
jgi:hypothetical protein